jgi:arylsulfatase A-like enzyme
VTTSHCCPSRATFLRGQYSHNHGVLTNGAPLGGEQRFRELGHEKSTIATWLHKGGYRTVEIGKYLNQHEPPNRRVGTCGMAGGCLTAPTVLTTTRAMPPAS